MIRFFFSFALFWGNSAFGDWEVAVATGNGVELLSEGGQTVGVGGAPGATLALAFDPLRGHLFFSDSTHPNTSIFRMALSASGIDHHVPEPLVNRTNKKIDGVAYDTLTDSLYWTAAREKRIMKASLSDGMAVTEIIHQFEEQIPLGVAVDPCRRYLYWTNAYVGSPSIERSRLDGTERESIISTDPRLPKALALSVAESALYWLECTGVDGRYWIQRSELDGSGQRTVVASEHQRPYSLAVAPSQRSVYWTDWTDHSVWKAPTDLSAPLESPALFKRYSRGMVPKGIVSLTQDSFHHEQCKEIVSLRKKLPASSHLWGGCRAGERVVSGKCEPWSCHNFCLGEGANCSLDSIGLPSCSCPPGLVGERCQFSSSLCSALCSLDRTIFNESCRCRAEEIAAGWGLKIGPWEGATMGLAGGVVCLALLLVAALCRLRKGSGKKPPGRSRRRFRINPPQQQRDQCEIAIENCCNMNVCETPCYEPDFPAVAPPPNDLKKKEEQKNLLRNMEVNCGELY